MRWSSLTAFTLFLSIPGPGQGAAPDYCAYGNRANLILVDRTTAYDNLDKEVFAAGLTRIVDEFETGDRVIVHAITANFVQGERPFDRCVPGCPQKGFLDWLFSKCRDLQARANRTNFVRDFALTARRLLDDLREYPRSDIARSIARVTKAIDNAMDPVDQPLANVYVFSDLIENSTELPWPTIIELPPANLVDQLKTLGIQPKLGGANVYVFGFGRFHDKSRTPLRSVTESKVRDFWSLFFSEGGASDVHIELWLE